MEQPATDAEQEIAQRIAAILDPLHGDKRARVLRHFLETLDGERKLRGLLSVHDEPDGLFQKR